MTEVAHMLPQELTGTPIEQTAELIIGVNNLIAEQSPLGLKMTPFNAALYRFRQELGLTQKALGIMVGVSAPSIGHFETLRAFPDKERAQQIARVLGKPVEEVFPAWLQEFTRPVSTPATVCVEVPMSEVGEILLRRAMEDDAIDPFEKVEPALLR